MGEATTKGRTISAADQDAQFLERRQSPRYRLRDVRGNLTWAAADGSVDSAVTVINISGGGAAVLAGRAPEPGQAVRLRLHCESALVEPIEAEALAATPADPGKAVVRLRFARWVSLDAILEKYQERRLWQRYPALEPRATLTWADGSTEQTMPGDLLNISGGGAAFVSEVPPPPDIPLWLALEASARLGAAVEPVEARLVATSADPTGRRIAHLQFVDACPMEFFELVVNGVE